jgi:hypothetical protein
MGLGDWQTQYLLYRLHRRDLYFTETIQVRRAHSDHVQVFGETGWPGPVRGSPLLAAQVGAFAFAMLTDSMFEYPYLKLEILLVAFLATQNEGFPPSGELNGGRDEVDEPLVQVVGQSEEVLEPSEEVVGQFVEVDEPLVQVVGRPSNSSGGLSRSLEVPKRSSDRPKRSPGGSSRSSGGPKRSSDVPTTSLRGAKPRWS